MEKEIVWCLGRGNELRKVVDCCADCVLMPDPRDLEEFALILDEFSSSVVAPVWREFSWEFVKMSHEAGALAFVDEQSETSWPHALEWGADGIQTDHPAELIEYVKNRDQD